MNITSLKLPNSSLNCQNIDHATIMQLVSGINFSDLFIAITRDPSAWAANFS